MHPLAAAASPARLLLAALLGASIAAAGCRSPSEGAVPLRAASAPARPHPTLPGAPALAPETVLTRIAFGSCNHQDKPQPLWTHILAGDPQLWIWTGDNIYGDSYDMSVMAAKYAQQQRQPDYARLVQRVPIIGVWDDHDYGLNDGGREFAQRAASQQLALDFLGEPPDGPRRAREGLHAAYSYGPAGRRVKVVLLDTRYFRDSLPPRGQTSQGDILGDAQWRWLEQELRASDAQLHFIVSSIQLLPQDHRFEKWANFPRARERLLDMLVSLRVPGAILISGDRHIAELSRLDDPRLGYPLYELTASGLTHTWSERWEEANRYRVGELLMDLNYGTADIDWTGRSPRVTLRVFDSRNGVRIEQGVQFGPPAP